MRELRHLTGRDAKRGIQLIMRFSGKTERDG